jgi:hypothetical protein
VDEQIETPAVTPTMNPPPELKVRSRRNSISIAPFTTEIDISKLSSMPPVPALPYHLDSTSTPNDASNQQVIFRVPPLLFSRGPQK